MKEHVKTYKLKNGLQTLFIPNNQINYVGIMFTVKAGSNYEKNNQIGVSHILEHLIMSKHREILDNCGGKTWGVTNRDEVIFYVKVLKEYYEQGVEFLATILLDEDLSKEVLEVQKNVICHEIERSLNSPEKVILRKSYQTIFQGTRMQILSTGEVENVKKIKLEEVLKFKKKFYNAQNSVVSIIGNLNNEEVESTMNKYFSYIPEGKIAEDVFIEPIKEKNILNLPGSYNQKHIKIDFNGYKLKDKERYAMSILSFIVNSKLNSEIRNKKAMCYVINVTDFNSGNFGTFSIYTASDNLKIVDEILNELYKIEITNIDLPKKSVISDFVFDIEHTSQILDFYNTNYIYGIQSSIKDEIEKYKKVTKKDVERVYKYIKNQKPKITILG